MDSTEIWDGEYMYLEIDCMWSVKKLDESRTLLSFWIG